MRRIPHAVAARSTPLVFAVLVLGILAVRPALGAASGSRREIRSRAELRALVKRVGPTLPEWWDSEPLQYPETLDLSWPKPKQGEKWSPRKYVGQYLISVIFPNPSKWRGSAKLLHHILERDGTTAVAGSNATDRLAYVYATLLGDYARAAHWWEKLRATKGALHPHQAVGLADCYWNLGSKSEAVKILQGVPRGTTKLWAEMGELDKALAAARRDARGRWPYGAILAAGNACRSYGRYDDAVSHYRKVLAVQPVGKRAKAIRMVQQKARDAVAATEVFRKLNLSRARSGTFSGSAQGFRGPIRVQVTLADGAIREIKVTEHQEDWFFRSLTEMPRQLVARKGVEGVHAVTRATKTSDGIVNAVAAALAKAAQ